MRLSMEEIIELKEQYIFLNGGERAVKNTTIMNLIDTIEALQQEIEQYQERLREIEATARGILRDRTEFDKVTIQADNIITLCGNIGEQRINILYRRNYELQQEIAQIREALARAREVLEIIFGLLEFHEPEWFTRRLYHNTEEALAAIEKAIGGGEDGV